MDNWREVWKQRELMGVSRRQFAALLGIKAGTLGNWERRGRRLGDELQAWVANALRRCQRN